MSSLRPRSAAYKAAFEKAKGEVKDVGGATAEVKFTAAAYPSFKLDDNSPAVQRGPQKAVQSIGLKPTLLFSDGWS